jgi:hypothetical protein
MRKVKITDVRKGKGARQHITFAHLTDAETGDLMIAANLDYIVAVCADDWHGFELVNALEALRICFPNA